MHITDTHKTVRVKKTAVCPTCQQHSTFEYMGEQRWPEKVAKAANIPPVTQVWSCTCCLTTLLENSLNFD